MVNKDIPQASCLCEICENLIFLAKSLSPKLNLLIQTNIHSLVEEYSCDPSWEILLHVDYSENYVNKEDEMQSAYFGHDSFSIFTTCCYLRDADGKLFKENVQLFLKQATIRIFLCK